MTTAVVAALLHYLGVVNLSESARDHHQEGNCNDDLDLVHMIAQTSHCIAQGKIGSGFDVSCAVYGSHCYVRFSPEVLSSAQVPGVVGNFVFVKDAFYEKPDISKLPFPTYLAPEDEDEDSLEPITVDLGELDPFKADAMLQNICRTLGFL